MGRTINAEPSIGAVTPHPDLLYSQDLQMVRVKHLARVQTPKNPRRIPSLVISRMAPADSAKIRSRANKYHTLGGYGIGSQDF